MSYHEMQLKKWHHPILPPVNWVADSVNPVLMSAPHKPMPSYVMSTGVGERKPYRYPDCHYYRSKAPGGHVFVGSTEI